MRELKKITLSEDWLAVIIAFILILLSALQVLGDKGWQVKFSAFFLRE